MLLLSGVACAQQVTSLNIVSLRAREVTLLVRLNRPAPPQGVTVTIGGAAYASTVIGYNQTEGYVNAQLMPSSAVATFIATGGGGSASASTTLPKPTPTPIPSARPGKAPEPVVTNRKITKLDLPATVTGVVTEHVILTKGPATTLFITCGPFLFAKPFLEVPADATQATFNIQAGEPRQDTPAEVRVQTGDSRPYAG